MTAPWPIVNSNGVAGLRSQEASNCLPPLNRTPTYWTLTLSPSLAAAPVPVTTSDPCSSVGALPVALGTVGLVLRSVLTPVTFVCTGSGAPAGRCLTVDFVEASSAGSVVAGSPSILEPSFRNPSSLLPPHPAARPAARDRTLRDSAMGRVLVMGSRAL